MCRISHAPLPHPDPMNILVIGLGSMGKRRIRNLIALGVNPDLIAGFDTRPDRRDETHSTFSVQTFETFESACTNHNPEAFVISVPPNLHYHYLKIAIEKNVHAFVEASVTDKDKIWQLARSVEQSSLVIAPSCTMQYFPGPSRVKAIINSGSLGRPLFFTYHTGQYLPDWHPWEDIQDFYVSNRETGGCREIVPFELTWINDIFGYPTVLSSYKEKLTQIDADIDDLYSFTLRYPGSVIGTIMIDVISRPVARRELHVTTENGQISYSGYDNTVRYICAGDSSWTIENLDQGTKYNTSINPEEPYISELSDFIDACSSKCRHLFPNTLLRDWTVLQALDSIEKLAEKSL